MVQISGLQAQGGYHPSSPSLRELADRHGLSIGAAVSPGPLRGDRSYAQALAHEFNSLTVENALKFGPVHPQPDVYAFADADLSVDFAEKNGMQVRGHVLIWHQQLAGWVEKGDWTREELIEVMREHIFTVVGRYKGRIQVWDVVNEAISDSGAAIRSTVWHKAIGDDYLDLAFQFAHEADPEAKLFYNDFNAEQMNRKADAVYELVKGMLERGVPIHGVGLQMHITAARPPDWASVAGNIARLNALGLEVHITELDVRVTDPPGEAKFERQAEVYRDAMQTCLDAEACTAFITWGFTDRYSWVPSSFKGSGSALLFDESYQPKPAYNALRKALE
ncbi:MAG: endo-1,4-beta-xylanase [Anaerolineae bacterium]|nr:endo-1,4-beta-xylanase [Anaerolineae bacterium]